MRLRVFALTVVVAATLALPSFSSGAAGEFDRWTGTWTVGAKNKQGKFYAFGNMTFRLHGDDRTVTGSYAFSGGGTINGQLNQRLGRELCGTYKQPDPARSGKYVKGKFCFTIARGDPDRFTGTSHQTQPSCGVVFGCPVHYREGHKS